MAFCPNCGKEITEGIKFCTSCGAPLADNDAYVQQQKKKEEDEQREKDIEYLRKELAAAEKKKKSAIVWGSISAVCIVFLFAIMNSYPKLKDLSWIFWAGGITIVLDVINYFTAQSKIEETRQKLRQRGTY